MRKIISILTAALVTLSLSAQNKTQCGTLTGQEKYPLKEFTELPNHNQPDLAQWSKVKGTMVSWGDTDRRYAKEKVPMDKVSKSLEINGWRGERVSAQAVVWTMKGEEGVRFEISDLKGKKGSIPKKAFETGFLRYVMTDGVREEDSGACGLRLDHTQFDSSLVADCIDPYLSKTDLSPMETRPIWISCNIPANTPAGLYKGKLTIKSDSGKRAELALSINVDEKTLPAAKDWKFHLDLWQNPFAVARYYQVPVWSQEHLDALRPIMERLASAGQKIVTASIIHWPWNSQTEDPFASMVTWVKRLDGSWEYHYDVFDKWVEFMMSCGIDQQINCYSMVPWRLSFRYFDQSSDSLVELHAGPGDQAFEDYWVPFLKDFAKHLKQKGWFEKTAIAMDERDVESMQKTIAVIRKAVPDFKIALAGSYHKEIDNDIYDYCVGIKRPYPEGVVARRQSEGKKTTYYTCCAEKYPNIFTFSEPVEGTYLSYVSAARKADGYLRWAFNSWPVEPLLDSRFRTWAAGDTYCVYPGNRSSIRFEKLLEGIQDYEKIRILREEYSNNGNTSALETLEAALLPFNAWDLEPETVEELISKVKSLLK